MLFVVNRMNRFQYHFLPRMLYAWCCACLFLCSLWFSMAEAADLTAQDVQFLRAEARGLDAAGLQQLLERARIVIPRHENMSYLEQQYNALVTAVFLKQAGPEDVRLNGAPLVWHAAGTGLLESLQFLILENADTAVLYQGEDLICRAALAGNREVVRFLASECQQIYNNPCRRFEWKGSCGILRRAAQSGSEATLSYLYGKVGWQVPLGRNGESIIDNAGMCGHDKTIRYLLKQGCPRRFDEILLRAARSGNLNLVRMLIEKEGANPHYKGTAHFTPLMTAAQSGNLDVVCYLVETHKVNVNARSRLGDTALLLAARSGNVQMVRYLIQQQAQIKAESKGGGDIVAQAAASGNMALLRYVITLLDEPKDAPARALCYAARHGHKELVEQIIRSFSVKVDVIQSVSVQHAFPYEDLVGESGVIEVEKTTPLMAAIASGNTSLVEFLLNHRADIQFSTGEDEELLTPMRAAVRRGQPQILRLLMDRIELQERDALLLHQAAQNGNAACVRHLIQCGWDVNAVDTHTGLSPIQAACISGMEAPGSVRWNYDTGSGHAECVRLLLQAGADVFFEKGRKAKSLALHNEVPLFDCAAILWHEGTPISNEEMIYPLHRAAEFAYTSWVRLLLPGLQGDSAADTRENPLFTVCNTADSYQPAEKPILPSPHVKCAELLHKGGGLNLTLENRRYLLSNGLLSVFHGFLPVEPTRGTGKVHSTVDRKETRKKLPRKAARQVSPRRRK